MSTILLPGQSTQPILTAAKWAVENDHFLADFADRFSLPHLALVTKGQYLSVGAPNVASPNLKPYVVLHSRQKMRKVLGQLVKIKDGKGRIATNITVAIPESYSGLFEILSEDGRPVKCLQTVLELTEKFPELCLVRQTCKAYLPDHDGELRSLFHSRTIEAGEMLTLVGKFSFKRTSFLRCFDETGSSVYLKMSQKGKFSPVARKDAITGVHYVRNLLCKRMPLTVRLIQGTFPPELKPPSTPVIIRLQSVIEEDLVFAYSLQKPAAQLLLIPINAHLKLAPTLNQQQLTTNNCEFRSIVEHCEETLPSVLGKIALHSAAVSADEELKRPPTQQQPTSIIEQTQEEQLTEKNVSQITISDEEIDQLYDYIRGLAPLPKSVQPTPPPTTKPPPPPLDTIPSRPKRLSERQANATITTATTSPTGTASHGCKKTGATDNASMLVQVRSEVTHAKSTNLDRDQRVKETSTLNSNKPQQQQLPPEAEKRLDAVVYGKNANNAISSNNYHGSGSVVRLLPPITAAINRLRNNSNKGAALSKSHEKLQQAVDAEKNYVSKIQLDGGGGHSKSQWKLNISAATAAPVKALRKPRPLSMVIPETTTTSSRMAFADCYASSYLPASPMVASNLNYRSFINLNFLDQNTAVAGGHMPQRGGHCSSVYSTTGSSSYILPVSHSSQRHLPPPQPCDPYCYQHTPFRIL